MRFFAIPLLAMIISFTSTTPSLAADEPRPDSKLGDKLIGTWKLVSAKPCMGDKKADCRRERRPSSTSPGPVHVAFLRARWPAHEGYRRELHAQGGTDYVESPEYSVSGDFDLIKGKAQSFTCKIEGNKWFHNGKLSNGLTIEEVWERVQK
jgi:hypothetical protein